MASVSYATHAFHLTRNIVQNVVQESMRALEMDNLSKKQVETNATRGQIFGTDNTTCNDEGPEGGPDNRRTVFQETLEPFSILSPF